MLPCFTKQIVHVTPAHAWRQSEHMRIGLRRARGCSSPVIPVRTLMTVKPMDALLRTVKFLRSSCL